MSKVEKRTAPRGVPARHRFFQGPLLACNRIGLFGFEEQVGNRFLRQIRIPSIGRPMITLCGRPAASWICVWGETPQQVDTSVRHKVGRVREDSGRRVARRKLSDEP